MPSDERRRTSFGEAVALAAGLLGAAGMPEAAARRTAWALVVAELWGRSSHGLMRLAYYLPRLEQGGTDARAELRVVRDEGAVVSFDGGNGLGHWQCWHAAEVATERASRFGIGAAAVANSGHNGALGLYVLPMLEQNMVGLVFSNGPAVMPPAGGHAPLLSTSPIAAGVPTRPRPTIVDLATSAVARGRIAQAAAKGEAIPEGWAFDAAGAPTTDAAIGLAGMVAPMAGPKGYALALLVEALTGALVGPALAGDIGDSLTLANAPLPQRSAHLVLAIDPGATDGDGHATDRLAELAKRVGETGGRLPGARYLLGDELDDTVPVELAPALADELGELARRFGVACPASLLGAGEGRKDATRS